MSSPRVRVQVAPQATGDVEPPRKRGRPKGSLNKFSKDNIKRAQAGGELPHEFLLRIARGEVIETPILNSETGEVRYIKQVPDLPMRVDAAKNAAPYFAPKLSAVQVMQNADDSDLDSIIAELAAQAGVGPGPGGEGTSDED
jgi:hypothetical protein